jgi:hypothetical protein
MSNDGPDRTVFTMGFNITMWKEQLLFGQDLLWSRRTCWLLFGEACCGRGG